jgi:DNA-binding MarR family transcriptional regulator
MGAIEGLVQDLPEESHRLVSERVRLGMLSALAVNDRLSFGEIRNLLGTTDGNLSVHARKLEEAGYVLCRKGFDGRIPRTDYELAEKGRRALARYLDHMEALLRATRR